MQGEVRSGSRYYGAYARNQSDEQRRVNRTIDYMEDIHSKMRFTSKKSVIAHTLGEANPYELFKDSVFICKDEKNQKVLDALTSLTARVRRHAKHFLQLCETFPEKFDDETTAIKLIETLDIMKNHDLPCEISDKLKRRLILAKLAHVVDNE